MPSPTQMSDPAREPPRISSRDVAKVYTSAAAPTTMSAVIHHGRATIGRSVRAIADAATC